jgi:phosphate:Na+ symporter
MLVLVDSAMTEMVKMVAHPDAQGISYTKSRNIENEINNYRSHLKGQNLTDIGNGQYSYQLGVYYTDFINEC